VLSRHHFATKAEARNVVLAWCHEFYNTRRLAQLGRDALTDQLRDRRTPTGSGITEASTISGETQMEVPMKLLEQDDVKALERKVAKLVDQHGRLEAEVGSVEAISPPAHNAAPTLGTPKGHRRYRRDQTGTTGSPTPPRPSTPPPNSTAKTSAASSTRASPAAPRTYEASRPRTHLVALPL
jgi:hypothetical protein